MNKRIKKKRKDARKLEKLEETNAALFSGNRWLTLELDACNKKLRKERERPTICSHSIEPNYCTHDGVEMHRLRVNAPLCINHSGPLRESDVYNIATKLAEALQWEAITQLMPHISTGIPR